MPLGGAEGEAHVGVQVAVPIAVRHAVARALLAALQEGRLAPILHARVAPGVKADVGEGAPPLAAVGDARADGLGQQGATRGVVAEAVVAEAAAQEAGDAVERPEDDVHVAAAVRGVEVGAAAGVHLDALHAVDGDGAEVVVESAGALLTDAVDADLAGQSGDRDTVRRVADERRAHERIDGRIVRLEGQLGDVEDESAVAVAHGAARGRHRHLV